MEKIHNNIADIQVLTTESKHTKSKKIADEVLNEMLKDCFEKKDFEGMSVIVKMKTAIKNL